MLIPRRAARAALCIGLFAACSWTVRQEWATTYRRWLEADRAVSPYGGWSRCFEPGATQLYRWLRAQNGPSLVVVSNFHEYITLETGIPALPIPPDAAALDRWIDRIRAARGVTDPQVLFVLDPDNKWRNYWIPRPADVVRSFRLTHKPNAPAGLQQYLYDYDSALYGLSRLPTPR